MWFAPRWWRSGALVVVLAVTGCSSASGDPEVPELSLEPVTTSAAPPQVNTTAGAVPTTASPGQTTTQVPAPSTTTSTSAPPPPSFRSSIHEIDDDLAARMTTSWREGCPVALSDLRYVLVSHWDSAGEVRIGELVVAAAWAEELVQVFGDLFEAGFPIQQMRLIDDFAGSDPASMVANNTSAFNCREVAYRPGVWSNHASGTAIDVNPRVNPYVDGDFIDPPEGAPYIDRSVEVAGGIYPGDAVTQAFGAIGWEWGGDWSGAADYQHFSAAGG